MSEERQYSSVELDRADAFETFLSLLRGRDQAYFSDPVADQNIKTLNAWAESQGMSFADGATLGYWQLSFQNCKPQLALDTSAPILARVKATEDAAFRERISVMSVSEIKANYQTDADFKARYDRLNRGQN